MATADQPNAPRSLFVRRGDRRLHLLEWAPTTPAATLLCVHGGCANAHWWYPTAQLLGVSHRVLALDLCGHGESDPLPDGNYSLDGHRDDVVHVAAELDLRDFAIMGHSFGGFVSLAALPALGARLAALILADSRGHIRQRAARYLNALGKFPNPVYASREEALSGFQLLPRETVAAPAVLDHVAGHSICEAADGTWSLTFDRRALRAARAREFDKEIRQWQGPTLLLRGALSTALSAPALAELAVEIPQAQVVQIADAHHHVMLDQPERFAQAIETFLRSQSLHS